MIKKTVLIFVIFLSLVTSHAWAKEEQHFLLIVVPDLSFNEIEYLLKKDQDFVTTGALVALNVRPDGAYSYLNNMVTLSTGTKGVGISDWNSFERGELFEGEFVESLQQRWTGKMSSTGLFHPLFHILQKKNNETSYKAQIGVLGETLKNHHIFRYVIGQSDLGEKYVRYGSLFTIDQQGESLGNLSCCVQKISHVPFGQEMDNELVLQEIEKIIQKQKKSFIVVEWGDISRLFEQKRKMTEEHFIREYDRIIKKLFMFVDKSVDNSRFSVMLLSPMMHSDAYKEKKQLAPLMFWPKDMGISSGQLVSSTTRQANIVSNLDIAPTILASFQITPPSEMTGHPLIFEEQEQNRSQMIKDFHWIFTVYETRGVVLSSYITLLTILLVGTIFLLWKKDMGEMWITFGKVVILAGMSSPFWFLVTSHMLKYIGVGTYFWVITILSLTTGYVLTKFTHHPLVLLGSILFIAISIDLLLGTPLMQRSYLGYDPVIGARYYGIGNEYAGVYIIAALFVILPFFKYGVIGYTFITIIFLQLFVFLAAPMFGTNAGATLAAAVAFSFLVYLLFLKQKSKAFKMMIFMIFGGLALVLLYVMQLFGESTHIGDAFSRLFTGDFIYIKDIIERKLAMNWKIFRYSNWTQLFVTTYVLIGFLLWRYKDKFSSGANKTMLQTGIIASIALLLLNDSGVVAAATSMFLLVSASYYWLLCKKGRP